MDILSCLSLFGGQQELTGGRDSTADVLSRGSVLAEVAGSDGLTGTAENGYGTER